MTPIYGIVAVAVAVWGAVYLRRGALLTACTGFVVLGYMLPHPFWHVKLGVPLTVDRLALAGIVVMLACHWRWARLAARRLVLADWALAALLVYLTVRCYFTPPADQFQSTVGPWWRIIAAFWMPAALYASVRLAPLGRRQWLTMLWALTGLGVYLAWTAAAEVHQQWWAVFPRFIGDPTLGTHFGRARGPALMSASLGVYLTACFWATWSLWPRVARPVQALLAVAMGAMAVGVFYTYTRSTWLGLAAGLAVIPLLQMPRRWRLPVASSCLLAGVVCFGMFGHYVTNITRKDADGSAAHSVYQRASFAYVSLRMFREDPIFGCGISRFYDKKLPYLSDRSQRIELESIRYLDHHNTLLSVLVETGLVGITLLSALLALWTKATWDALRRAIPGTWQHGQALFGLAVLIAYFATAVFHDLTLSPTEHWLLFLTTGVTVAMTTQRQYATASAARRLPTFQLLPRLVQNCLPPKRPTRPAQSQISLFGMKIDALQMHEAAARVLSWCAAPKAGACKFVVTPNVDHAVLFQSNAPLRAAYEGAALVLADGAPVVLASHLLNKPLPQRVAGSDLAPALFERASATSHPGAAPRRTLRVFLLGAAPGVAERAQRNIESHWKGVDVVGVLSPPLGFENDHAENERIVSAVAAAQPDLLVVGLGAPKQELWIAKFADRLDAKVALCVGATIDFLAGQRQRAPQWMRAVGLEWVHRLASEPKRLAKRYLRDAWVFPQLVYREWRNAKSPTDRGSRQPESPAIRPGRLASG